MLLDDYTDDVLAFHSEEEFRKRLLDYAHAFIMGVPLTSIDKGYIPDVMPAKNTTKRRFSYDTKETIKTEKTKPKQKDSYVIDSSKNDDDDDDDLDWL